MQGEQLDIDAARRSYRRRAQVRRNELHLRWEEAREQAQRAVRLIVEGYHPTRIVQWGSILRPEHFSEVSDIDIAVEGIGDPVVWSSMERELLGVVTFPLDLVPLDRIHLEHRRQILARGAVVYERS